jgi:exopolysaccharide biosynthesis protein
MLGLFNMAKVAKKLHFSWTKLLVVVVVIPSFVFSFYKIYQKQQELHLANADLAVKLAENARTIESIESEITRLNNEDLRKLSLQTKKEMEDLKSTFKATVNSYEQILLLQERGSKITGMLSQFSSILNFLSKNDLDSALKVTKELNAEIEKEKTRLAQSSVTAIPANVPDIKEAPASGFRRQKVTVGESSFLVDVVAADLNSTKVIVDTASDSTCTNNCPVLPLATYVSRSGAYAGINGTYFCPETYPSCAEKKNTFDVLVMNKNKVYFNSDNNVYSTVPVAIFSGNSGRFIGQTSGWGRDTGVDAVIANRPLLVLDGNIMFGSGGEDKEGIKSNRSFLGSSSNTGYIGVVHSATVAESAKVLQAMGIKNAINLDSGGSTALWSGGYKVGPGRNLPNVVLFVRK